MANSRGKSGRTDISLSWAPKPLGTVIAAMKLKYVCSLEAKLWQTWEWKWSEVAQSCPTLWDPWTVARQAPPSMGFSRQEYWSGLPFPSPGYLPDPGNEPGSPALEADALTSEPPGKPMINLDSVLKNKDITLLTKVCIAKAIVFPVVMYGCESWTIKKFKCQRIDAFELCWRRPLRVPWTARRLHQSILKEINPEYSLEGLMLKLKLQCFFTSHMKSWFTGKRPWWLGKIEGRRSRGWQRMPKIALLTQWICIWANSRRQCRTDVLQPMGPQSDTT